MSHENQFNNPPQETLKSEEEKLEQIRSVEKRIMKEHGIRMEKLKEDDYVEDSIPREKLRECEPEIEILDELFEFFEDKYPPEELKLIVAHTLDEASNHPLRAPAREALRPIDILLKKIKRETNIMPGKIAELEAKYKEFSNAVGFFNNGKLDHDR